MSNNYLSSTSLVDYNAPSIQLLIKERDWQRLSDKEKIGVAYNFVRDEILFGYNSDDALSASKVLADGYGQCNTKGTLLMALLRGLGIQCRFHGFTIDKSLQRGVVPELVYPLAPENIIHSWIEIFYKKEWLNLEGFILDSAVLSALQKHFPERTSLCAYGTGTNCLQSPDIEWNGTSTYIQKTGINKDLGIFDGPDEFYRDHRQLTGLRGAFYRYVVRHWMNHRVAKMRDGHIPKIPGGEHSLVPAPSAQHFYDISS